MRYFRCFNLLVHLVLVSYYPFSVFLILKLHAGSRVNLGILLRMKKSIIASLVSTTLVSLAFTTSAFAEEIAITTDDVLVKANRFEQKDTETTYASEVHTAKQIEASGAATLYDFLSQQTSLNVSPNIGNRATPTINLRGFGTENGFQNVVITVDGQRINNIDLSPQLLAGIPISNVERIEISKGSGSVIYGDGATAGAIQIYTKNKTGVTLSASFGNHGQQNHYVSAGISEQYFDLSANLAHDSYDGFSKEDVTGHKDAFTGDTHNVKLKIKPIDALRINIEGTSSRNDIRYINTLSKAQFNSDPRQDPLKLDFLGNPIPYTHQSFNSDQWRIGAEYEINQQLKISAYHFNEDKLSEFVSATPSKSNSTYESNDISLRYQNDAVNLIAGYQDFDGERKSFSDFGFGPSRDKTAKKNEAFYLQGAYTFNAWTVSAGARDETVKYKFKPIISPFGLPPSGKDKADIDAWDIGVNYRFNNEVSLFANYNQAYEAPDIDRLFNFSGGFNGFLNPAKAKTFNIGLNHTVANNRLKITAFHTNLDDEIYLVPSFIDPTFKNTNLDKSHKYGLEIQDYYKFNDQLNTSVIYTYTRAIIDKENDGAGTFNNKDLPGVPKHSVVANLNYQFFNHATLNLNHTWRAKAYAFNDFQNNFKQRQEQYESTNVALNYQYKNYQLFTSINNLFEHENSIQVADDAIYPVDFVRTWRVGVKADF